jgi:hypothetical protein
MLSKVMTNCYRIICHDGWYPKFLEPISKKEIGVTGKAQSSEKAAFRRQRDEPQKALCSTARGT